MTVVRPRYLTAQVSLLPLDAPRFVGLEIPQRALYPDLIVMRKILGERAHAYEDAFKSRYKGHYHLTLLNSEEYRLLDFNRVQAILGRAASVELVGLGRHFSPLGDTFYTVCRSQDLELVRRELTDVRHDFHVTLGFDGKDVHGVRKDLSTLLPIPLGFGASSSGLTRK